MGHRTTTIVGTVPPRVPRRVSEVRIGEPERTVAVAELRQHCSEGRLSIDEFDDRVGEVYDARTEADLVRALRDLPEPAPLVSQVPAPVTAHDGGCPGKAERSFGAHLTTYVLVMALLIGIWALTTPFGYFWPEWPMLGWGIGVVAHAAGASKHRHHRSA